MSRISHDICQMLGIYSKRTHPSKEAKAEGSAVGGNTGGQESVPHKRAGSIVPSGSTHDIEKITTSLPEQPTGCAKH